MQKLQFSGHLLYSQRLPARNKSQGYRIVQPWFIHSGRSQAFGSFPHLCSQLDQAGCKKKYIKRQLLEKPYLSNWMKCGTIWVQRKTSYGSGKPTGVKLASSLTGSAEPATRPPSQNCLNAFPHGTQSCIAQIIGHPTLKSQMKISCSRANLRRFTWNKITAAKDTGMPVSGENPLWFQRHLKWQISQWLYLQLVM